MTENVILKLSGIWNEANYRIESEHHGYDWRHEGSFTTKAAAFARAEQINRDTERPVRVIKLNDNEED